MAKINFTDEHMLRLRTLIADSVLYNSIIVGPMGQNYTVIDLMHCLSINSLRSLSASIYKKRVALSIEDKWIENPNAAKIAQLDDQLELIDLIIGYQLKTQEIESNKIEKERIQKQIDELVQSQKSPQDLIADLQAKLSELD